jgi:hypothetical protein
LFPFKNNVKFPFICWWWRSAVLHHRWKIANIYYRHLKKKCEGDTIDLECKFDVFVAYSSDSLRWLRSTFVPMMQEEWSLNLCLKDRDYHRYWCNTADIPIKKKDEKIEITPNVSHTVAEPEWNRSWKLDITFFVSEVWICVLKIGIIP